jgi:excisionase family DNA binding protein
MMNDLNNPIKPSYLSTRQSAKILQVSLGTVQKMVEMGELVAWKTRGGHRRILASSLELQLKRRHIKIREIGSTQCTLLALFKREEHIEDFESKIRNWSIKLTLLTNSDTLAGLIQAVSTNPDVIYIDSLISPVEQVHLIHYLSKNPISNKIPLLIDENFIGTHPGVIYMAAENAGILNPWQNQGLEGAEFTNPLIYSYSPSTASAYEDLEGLIRDAITNKLMDMQ